MTEFVVHAVDLSIGNSAQERARALLSCHERIRAEPMRNDVATRYIAAQAATRVLLGEAAGRAPNELAFTSGCSVCGATGHGKPRLLGFPTIGFSKSTSGGWLLLAIDVYGREIGVDIEVASRPVDQGTARLGLTPGEFRRWVSEPAPERTPRFLRLWTRKEAYLKRLGIGLARPPSSVSVARLQRSGEVRSVDLAPHVPDAVAAMSHPPGWIRELTIAVHKGDQLI